MRKFLKKGIIFTFLAVSIFLGSNVVINDPVYAMQLSQPKYLGSVKAKNALPLSAENQYYDFGEGKAIVRIYVDNNPKLEFPDRRSEVYRLGDPQNINNTVEIPAGGDKIYSIDSNDGKKFYVIQYNGKKRDGGEILEIVGKDSNGKYIKYLSNNSVAQSGDPHSDELMGVFGYHATFSTDQDTIIFDCQGGNDGSQWRYLFKWDETAQWFGIDYQDRSNWKEELINKALNTTYSIWDQNITLNDGTYENDQPYYQKVKYIRSDQYPIIGNVNTDGVQKNTVVGVLLYTGGGSGIFVHVVATTVTNDTVIGNKAFPIGDRANVREVRIENGNIIVNYSERLHNEIKTKILVVRNNSLEEIK